MRVLLAALVLMLACQTAASDQLQLVGQARLKVLFWPVYESRLYSPDGSYQPDVRPLRLEIQYLMDIKSDDLVKRTAAEWQAQERYHPNQEQWLEQLSNIWPDVQDGDVIALHLQEDRSSRFYFNGEPAGDIEDPVFGQQFLDIWLSPATTRPLLRERLLGQR